MLILPAEADEATVGTAVDRITKIVEPAGGAVGELDRWGRRRFAFEIAHENEGYYVVVRFRADPSVQPEIDRVLNIADEVIRHKVIQLPDAALAPAEPRGAKVSRAPARSAEAPAQPEVPAQPAQAEAPAATEPATGAQVPAEPEAADQSSASPAPA